MTHAELLDRYVSRNDPDAAPWNLSPECAYLDYRLRSWARGRIHPRAGLAVLNVGIGVGEWDDYLGYLAPNARLTSVDIDADICATFRARQSLERHPNPARVICADVLTWDESEQFDIVTLMGSTAAETGSPSLAVSAAARFLAPGGQLLLGLIPSHPSFDPHAVGLSVRHQQHDDTLTDLPISLFVLESSRSSLEAIPT